MQKVNIDGLLLPDYLVKLSNEGRWKSPEDLTILRDLTGCVGNSEFTFLPIRQMVRISKILQKWQDAEMAEIYGYASSKYLGKEINDRNILDGDKAVLIAANYDEEAICLDYRADNSDPEIVFSYWEPNNRKGKWKVISKNIRDFANIIGL